MKMCLLLTLFLSGCYYIGQPGYSDLAPIPSRDWSAPECLTIIIGAGEDNLRDKGNNIKVIATPYYPSVVKALGRRAQMEYRWDEKQFRAYVDNLVHESCGMFVDWDADDEPVYDGALKPLRQQVQFDSLMFLITLRNIGWPCGKKLRLTVPSGTGYREIFVPLEDIDCTPPDITRIEEMISLVNEEGNRIAPISIWGRSMNYLTNNEETLFVKFRLRNGDTHFLNQSATWYLQLDGFERKIRLAFPALSMR